MESHAREPEKKLYISNELDNSKLFNLPLPPEDKDVKTVLPLGGPHLQPKFIRL
jgi:hypothetical protein